MRISNLSILFVVIGTFVMGCAGKRNREPVTTYWNDARDCQSECENCARGVSGPIVESNPVDRSNTIEQDCRKQNVGQKAWGIHGNRNGLSAVEVNGAFNELNETSETGLPSTTRRSLSPTESAGSEGVEFQRQPDADAFSSPQKFLTPEKVVPDHTDWNPDQSSPLPKVDRKFVQEANVAQPEITEHELHQVKPLPIVSGQVVDKLPLKSQSNEVDDTADRELEQRHLSNNENRAPLKAKGIATETGKRDSVATDESLDSEPEPKSESFQLQDLFPSSIPNTTIWTLPDATPSNEKGARKTDDDIDWGLPRFVYPNGSQLPGNQGGNDSNRESNDHNQGGGEPPLNPPGSWQGNSSSSEMHFSNRSEQEIIRELRMLSVARRGGFENTAIISETRPGLKAVLLTAKPVPHYHQLLQLEQEGNLNASFQTRSDSSNRLIGSTPNRIPAQNVSNRRHVSFEDEFDFRPIPELTLPGELSLEPIEADKFLEEVIETFSFPPLPPMPPASVPDAIDKKDDQWFSSDSSLLTGSGLKEFDANENSMTDLPGNAGGSEAHFRFKQPSFQTERTQ